MESARTRPGLGVEHPRCPFCHAPVLPGREDAKQSCGECMAWHHAECWETHGGCAACNAQRPATSSARARAQAALEKTGSTEPEVPGPPPRAPWLRSRLVGALLGIGLLGGGVAGWLYARSAPPPAPAVEAAAWHQGFLDATTEEDKTRWCRVGAEARDPAAMNLLGFRLAGGIGCRQDMEEAVRWGRRGAELGHSNAMFGVGRMLELGYGAPQDLQEAAYRYRRAIEAGDPNGQPALEDLLRRHPELRDR